MRRWTRTDTLYALATAAAVAVVAFFVAGNFGLVASPLLSGLGDRPSVDPLVPLAIEPAAVVQPPPATTTRAAAPGSVTSVPPGTIGSPPAPPSPARDVRPPVSDFTTGDGAVLAGQPVTGIVKDNLSGVAEVRVTFTAPEADPVTVRAAVACNASRRSCNWAADPPATGGLPLGAGSYEVRVASVDMAGNLESPGPPPRTVTVATATPSGAQQSSDGTSGPKVVDGLLGTVDKLL